MAPRWPLLALLLASTAHGAPPALPPAPPPAEGPPAAPDELPRRSHELVLRAGAAAQRCDGAAPATAEQVDPCATLGAARGLGAAWYWRGWGHLALGVAAERSWFAWGARGALGEGRGAGGWTGAMLGARGYLRTEGRLEPYVGYGVGLGWLTLRGEGSAVEIRREGLAMGGQLGVEAWVSGRMRLGVEAEVRWQATGAAEVCRPGLCLGAPLARLPDRAFGLSATLTFGLGEEL